MKMTTSLIEEKRKDKVQMAHLLEPQNAHSTGEFALWHKMVGMHCFVWPPALQLWLGRQAGRFCDIFSISSPPISVFLFLMLDVR